MHPLPQGSILPTQKIQPTKACHPWTSLISPELSRCDTGKAMKSWQPPEKESHLLKVTQLSLSSCSSTQGWAARDRVSNLRGVQAAARVGVWARLGLAGVGCS